MRFHPKKVKPKAYYLKVLSPFLVIAIVLCWLNYDVIKRSVIDVNARASYTAYLDTKFEINELFYSDSVADRKDLVVKMSPSKYVSFQKERAKKTKDFILNHYNDTFSFNYYKAKVNFNKAFSNAELKLFGQYPDHFGDSDGHSFRIKFDGNEGFGKKKVNVCKPICRSFNLDRMLNEIYSQSFSGLNIHSEPINVVFNKQDYGIYIMEDFLDKYLVEENGHRESFIFEVVDNQVYYNHIPKDEKFIAQQTLITELVTSEDKIPFFERIDKEKLFGFLALLLTSNNNHSALDINLHWYYNPVSNKFEPTVRETKITKLERDINEPGFYNKLKSIISHRNSILTGWMDWIGKTNLNRGLSQAIGNINTNYKEFLKDSTYQDFRQKLIGFKSKMNNIEALFQSNLNRLKLNPPVFPKEITETITISKDTTLTSDFTISKHQHLVIEQGVNIDLKNDADILVLDGQISINGTNENPVNFIASTDSKSSIYIETPLISNIKNASFFNLSGLHKGIWQLPSAITLYESNATFTNCTFSNNFASDDMVNAFRSKAILFENCTFQNIASDAIDSDFSNVNVVGCKFTNIGNDGVDGSGSKITITNSSFDTVEDKAISAGEKSLVNSSYNIITNSELGLVCKDGSLLKSRKDVLNNNTLDVVAFTKKPFYAPPSLEIEGTIITSNLVEKEVKTKGLEKPIYSKNINKKLYGNQFGKASE